MTSNRHLALLGGLRAAPAAAAPESYTIATLVGGADLDLSGATIPAAGITIRLFGGVRVED